MTSSEITEARASRAALSTGQLVGTYRIEGFVGAGGMGEVYRARDTRLGRDVAIKILPRALASDAGGLGRFEREARILAALSHPNIATIHGIEESDGRCALVLELVEGETLSDRLRRQALSVSEALVIARQIADALDAAHTKGIVHRDIKPANLMIAPSGLVKVLDFGIAAVKLGEVGSMTPDATQDGSIRGTAPYMSPEQARGAPVDKRTDIWAFGCVLYEMLTGREAFARDTASDTLVAVLEREPDWSVLPRSAPPGLARLLQHCLAKDPRKRLRDIGDALAEIDELRSGNAATVEALPRGSTARWRAVAATAVIVASLAGGSAWLLSSREAGPTPLVRTAVTLPASVELDTVSTTASIAVSADGRRIAYVGTAAGRKRLYLRNLDEFDARVIEGTDGARYPFFSPDDQWIAFFTSGELKRVAIAGGAPIAVCDVVSVGRGATWGIDGNIVFASSEGRLMRVRSQGGAPQPIVSLDPETDARRHTWPRYLPDGSGLLSTIDLNTLAVLSFSTRHWRELLPGSQAQYLDAGYLVFHALQEREGQVNAVAFDVKSLSVRGSPVSVLDGAFRSANDGAAFFAVARMGTLVFAPGGYARTLVSVDRQGHRSPLVEERRGFRFPRVSPDGQHIAVTIDPRPSQIWIYDLQRGTAIPLATKGHSLQAHWTLDGQRVVYSGPRGMESAAADGGGLPSVLLATAPGARNVGGATWSADGTVAFQQQGALDYDLWIWRPGEDPRPLVSSPARENIARLSPDSRWLAYQSDESGRNEVYVRPFPNADEQRWTISNAGGWTPVWAPDGREIFYMKGASVMAAAVTTDAEKLIVSKPEELFSGPFDTTQDDNFDVFPDGQHFLMVERDPDANPTKLNVVQHWGGEVARIVQAAQRR
jgi:serine/threonine-protein kinase